MTYRELLNVIQMMAEVEPSLLNHDVVCTISEDEYFTVNNLFMEDVNQYLDYKQPVLVLDA